MAANNEHVVEYLTKKTKRDFVMGRITEEPMIPSKSDIESRVKAILTDSRNGIIGKITAATYKGVSNPDEYNSNFITVKDNIEFLMGEVAKEVNRVIDQINSSTIEKNNTVRQARRIGDSFTEIETGRLIDNSLSYSISDSFIDTSMIDMERTTAEINTNATNVYLSHINSNRLQFPHYRSQESITFTIPRVVV